jgi:hypothetical protein
MGGYPLQGIRLAQIGEIGCFSELPTLPRRTFLAKTLTVWHGS